MGTYIDLYECDYNQFLVRIIDELCIRAALAESILRGCGCRINNTYLILSNEYYEDEDPFSTLTDLLQSAATKDKDALDLILEICTDTKRSSVEPGEIAERLGIKLHD